MAMRGSFPIRSHFSAFLCLLLLSTIAAADLTPQQKQFLVSVEARLKQAKSNLNAAEEAAGPASEKTPEPRARLALSRSANARAQIVTVKAALAKLPAEDPTVKAMLESATQAEQAVEALETRLAGPAVPAPKLPNGQPMPAGTKLDYKQVQLLKDADFYQREIDGAAAALAQVMDQVKAAKDPDQLDNRLLGSAMATIKDAEGRKTLVQDRLDSLPKEGAGVAQAADRLAKAMAQIETAKTALTPTHERLQKLISPATYPKFDEDVVRIRGFAQMFADPGVLKARPEKAAEIVKQVVPAKEELAHFTTAYAPLVNQKTDMGKQVESAKQYMLEKSTAFDAAAAERKKALPVEIEADLSEAGRMADDAVKNQKPLYFGGGIRHGLENAETKLFLLTVLDASAGAALTKTLADAKDQIHKKEASLRDLVIAHNELPPDRYKGADKPALVERAIATWKEKQPDALVLTVRFPSEKWNRETYWRLQNTTWYKIDRSWVQAQLIVKENDRLAVIRPINLWIDHLAADKLTASPLHGSVKEELQPSSFMLVNKAK